MQTWKVSPQALGIIESSHPLSQKEAMKDPLFGFLYAIKTSWLEEGMGCKMGRFLRGD